MGLAQLLERAGPMLEASMIDNGESNLAMLRRLATPKVTGLRPRNRQPSAMNIGMDEGNGGGMLLKRKKSHAPIQQPQPTTGMGDVQVAGQVPEVEPGLIGDPEENPYHFPRVMEGAGPESLPVYKNVNPLIKRNLGINYAHAPSASPDDPTLLPRPVAGTPDMSKVAEPDIITAIAKLRERTLSPVSQDDDQPINEGALQMRPTQPLLDVPPDPNGPRSVSGLVYDDHGRPLKPQYLEPSSDAALLGRQEYIAAMQNYKPVNHNSRLKSGLITAGRGAMAGLQYGPGGAIGGALSAGIWGLADPTSDERYAKERDVSQAQGELAGDLKVRDANNQNLLDRARVYRELNPTGQVIETDNGVFRANGTNAQPITAGQGGPQLMPRDRARSVKEEIRHDPFTGRAEKWEIRPGEADKKVVGWSDPAKDMVQTQFGWVSPGSALQADATAENRNYTRDRQEQWRGEDKSRQEQWRGEDKSQHNTERSEQRLAAASKIYTDIVNANAEAGKYKNLAERTPATAKDSYGNFLKPYYESMADSEKQKGVGYANQLAQGYGDLYEAGLGDGGWAYAKLKPTPAGGQLQARPQSKAGKPGKIQPGENPAIRDYANHYFHGDYAAAVEAIKNQPH